MALVCEAIKGDAPNPRLPGETALSERPPSKFVVDFMSRPQGTVGLNEGEIAGRAQRSKFNAVGVGNQAVMQ